jgi:hypothetical protein
MRQNRMAANGGSHAIERIENEPSLRPRHRRRRSVAAGADRQS